MNSTTIPAEITTVRPTFPLRPAAAYEPLGGIVSGDALHTNEDVARTRQYLTVEQAEHMSAVADQLAEEEAAKASADRYISREFPAVAEFLNEGQDDAERLAAEQAAPLMSATVPAPAALALPDPEFLYAELAAGETSIGISVQGEGQLLTPDQADALASDVTRWALAVKTMTDQARHPNLTARIADHAFLAALDAINEAFRTDPESTDQVWRGLRAALNLQAGRDAVTGEK